ncbi:hypothetical protein E1211_20620 [Micromonospora sp. 15K316]|uniref:hypothetical protein n=1 Tax=Micromonospora sp. 15K316 TaxID=2530376 RepID=UPI0010444E45|nr:hypothetical protein [Micromonospora sp. 15K316]TDC32545.1 hypothetical protein E1211_20620 [Micromonospora sp. 15K316]
MATSRTLRLRRRSLLGVPALVAAALITIVTRPGTASAAPAVAPAPAAAPQPECLADLLGGA